MDVHRCRFIPYPISPINALAFSHSSSPDAAAAPPSSLRLAIGRANGDIEIWNPQGGLWVQEQILRGGKGRSIEGLAWTQEPDEEDNKTGKAIPGKLRLFSIGYSTVITEWDLAAGKPVRHSSANFGEIWCLSAQPSDNSPLETAASNGSNGAPKQLLLNGSAPPSHQKLVAGCADGSLVVLSTTDDELTYQYTLPRPSNRKARALSLAWRSRDVVVAGYSDSAIRVFDVRGKGRLLQTLSLGARAAKRDGTKSNAGRRNDILVWAVRCLADGTVVSGDSTGEIKIWDAGTLALLQRLEAHKADVLDLAASVDGSLLMSTGIDRRIITFRRTGSSGPEKRRWAEVSRQRAHMSDVKALAVYEAKGLSVVVSGGLDAQPIVMPLQRTGQEYIRRLAVSPSAPPLLSAPTKRLVASWWEQEMRIWQVGATSDALDSYDLPDGSGLKHDLVAKIMLQGDESISSCSFAHDGSLIVASTSTKTSVFRLEQRLDTKLLKVRKVDAPPALANAGSTLVSLSPDTRWLLRTGGGSQPEMFRISSVQSEDGKERIDIEPDAIHLDRDANIGLASGAIDQEYIRAVHRIAWSPDSRTVVTCDLEGRFDTWRLQDEDHSTKSDNRKRRASSAASDSSDDESSSPWCRTRPDLPRLNSKPLVLSFSPPVSSADQSSEPPARSTRNHQAETSSAARPSHLVVITSDHHILEFDTFTGRRTDWSRRNPPECLPHNFYSIRERAMGVVWDVTPSTRRLWVYGSSWLWMFDLDRDMIPKGLSRKGRSDRTALEEVGAGNKRKRLDGADEDHDDDDLDEDVRRLQSRTSGAGSKMPERLRNTGTGSKMIVTEDNVEDGKGEAEKVSSTRVAHALLDHPDDCEDEDAMDVDGADNALLRLRRGNADKENTDDDDADMEEQDALGGDNGKVAIPRSWGTFRYRPILGVVALDRKGARRGGEERAEEDSDDDPAVDNGTVDGDEDDLLEVVLVERPLWEADLPPRWAGEDR